MKEETQQRIDKRLAELDEKRESFRIELHKIATELDKIAAEKVRIETAVDFLNAPILSFHLSDRVQKILTENNIVTIEDIGEPRRLYRYRNFGDHAMSELSEKIGHLLI